MSNVPNAPIDRPAEQQACEAPRDCKHGQLRRTCQLCDLEAEEHILRYGGIIEVAVRNRNVAEYMGHWESRAEKAEAALKALALSSEKVAPAAAEYARKNPLGGPANVFYAMADRIRAGEDYWHVLDDYGFTTLDAKERAEKDADRYRWLRLHHWDNVWDWCVHADDPNSKPASNPEQVDAAIDRARAEKGAT